MKALQPLTISGFNGRWNRGSENLTPPDHFVDELNLRYLENGFKSREGFSLYKAASGNWNGSVVRLHTFSIAGQVDRLIILDNTGKFWDDQLGFAGSPILDSSGWSEKVTDFACATLNSRLYISPFLSTAAGPAAHSDGANCVVYVYDGVTARKAAGAAPAGMTLSPTISATVGNVLKGKRLFQLVYKTPSGHYTKPGPVAVEVYDPVDSVHSVDITIPAPPAAGFSVSLIATQVLDEYSGNKLEYEFFFVPNAEYTTAGVKTVNFFDSELIDSADDLNWLAETIPSGIGMATCSDRLIVTGPALHPNIAEVSKQGYPESLSTLSGYIETPNDGSGAVNTAAEMRGQLFLYKSRRHYATTPSDNDPNSWVVVPVDSALGAEPHGIIKVIDVNEHTEEELLTVDKSGVNRFSGNYVESDLCYKIIDLWNRVNRDYSHTIQACCDPDNMCVYVAVPLDDATSPSHILVFDYSSGRTSDKVKWSLWQLPRLCTSIVMLTDSKSMPIMYVGSSEGSIYKLDNSAILDEETVIAPVAIESFGQTAFMGVEEISVLKFGGYRIIGRGSGNLDVTAYTLDRVQTVPCASITMSNTPGLSVTKQCNIVNERVSFKFGIDAANEHFTINAINIYYKVKAIMRPM